MTDPAGVAAALLERLRRKAQLMPMLGSADSSGRTVIYDDGMRYVNPDGPAAATEIARLHRELHDAQEAAAMYQHCQLCDQVTHEREIARYKAALVAHNCGTPGCLCYECCREADQSIQDGEQG